MSGAAAVNLAEDVIDENENLAHEDGMLDGYTYEQRRAAEINAFEETQ
jgi:hypothetical protein